MGYQCMQETQQWGHALATGVVIKRIGDLRSSYSRNISNMVREPYTTQSIYIDQETP